MALALVSATHKDRGELLVRRSQSFVALGNRSKADLDLLELAGLELEVPRNMAKLAALICKDLAWRNLTGPETERDPSMSLKLAKHAAKLSLDDWTILITLGLAQYRTGDFLKAKESFEKNMHVQPADAKPLSLYLLSMCAASRSENDNARKLIAAADLEAKKNANRLSKLPALAEELKMFRAEAEALLANPQKSK